jgi:anaerobic selenocysteine-containing dehydrogenase
MGFSPAVAVAEVREFKLLRTTETRNTCPYCAVACGIVMYGLGDGAKNATASIIHIEGDPDHRVNRGTLCRQGAMVQLLLGNIGVSGGGMNALRGHSNIQGLTDLSLMTRDTRLGLEASSGLVPRDDSCSEF